MLTKYPAQCCLRVWDVLLFERTRRILFQAALALIDVNAKRMVEVSLFVFPYGQLDTNVVFCSQAQRLDRLMELATQMAPAQFDGSELLMVATAQFTDVTWGKFILMLVWAIRMMSCFVCRFAQETTCSSPSSSSGHISRRT